MTTLRPWLAKTPRGPAAARRRNTPRLRVESLETRVVPAGTPVGPDLPTVTEKVRADGPPLLTAPAMPGLADLDVAIAAAVQHAWQVPAGTATDRWVIQLPAGQSPAVFQAIGGVPVRQVSFWANTYEVAFATPRDVAGFPAAVADVTSPEFYYPVVERMLEKRFVPNDTLFGAQWHLRNTGQGGGTAGEDANLVPAWDVLGPDGQPVRGNGVVIGVVDDGLQRTHPDLAPNYDAADSFDFNFNDPDPSPDPSFDFHGTAAAGVAAARGNNARGVSGAAPEASLAGLRLIAGPTTDAREAAALGYHPNDIDIYSNSWGPADNATLGFIGPETLAAIAAGYNAGRGGLGNIYTWAAGNGLGSNDNVNYDAYANSRYVIAVGAVNDFGRQAWYSEPGAAMLVTAPSNGGASGITTTDLTGANGYNGLPDTSYTNDFGGTSSATPLVSGIVALMLDANPGLTARDVQHILVRTARKNDPTGPGWTTNGAGFHINHKYGFGTIDAQAAVALAATWSPVAAEQSASRGPVSVNVAVPDADPTGVTSSTTVSQNLNIEHVEVVFNATQTYRGDYRIVLTSPSGTQSVLAETHGDSGDNYSNWVFSTVRHWGESSAGQWTLHVSDGAGVDVGTFGNWTIRFYGTPPGAAPALTGIEASALTYIAGQGPLPVTQSLAAADQDGNTLAAATVTISANYAAGQDFLRFTNQNGITGTFNAGTGVLALSGTATLAQYQAALRSVRYENTEVTPSTAPRTVTFRVTDPTNLASNVRSRTIAISLVNKAPTLTAIPDPAPVNEDAGAQTVNLAGIGAGAGESQTLTVTATSSNPALVPDPTVNYTNPATTGTLSYAPAADQFGTAVITVTVTDTGGTANGGVDEIIRTFTVVVNSSNDAPAFAPGPDLFIELGSGAQALPGWATAVSAGPPDEAAQAVHFDVTADNTALFSVQPAVAPDGTLTFTPAPGEVGTATVSVTLVDDGGTANGGADAGPTVTFTIEVDVNDAPVADDSVVPRLTAVPKYRTDPAGDAVSVLGATVSDPNRNQSEGIAVVGLTGTDIGAWEYSLDGGANWQPFGGVSPGAARLVRQQDLIRFAPTGGAVGSPTVTYHAWDQTSDAAGDVVDLTVAGGTGGTTAFSTGTARARIRVAPALTPVVEDNTRNKGDKVVTLLTGLAGDADLKAKRGLAVTGLAATTAGVWQYSTTGGTSWKPIPAVSPAAALLLSDKDKVRFLPGPEQSGEASFLYRAWDQTAGIRGTTTDLSGPGATGGGTAFSAGEDVYFVQVQSANDRPVPDRAWQPALTRVAAGATDPAGDTIAALIGASVTDPDNDPRGIAVVGAKSLAGRWEYRLNGAGPWAPLAAATPKLAIPLRAADEIRFVPNATFSGTARLTYRAWDQTAGAAGTPTDATRVTAFSATTHTALVVVGGTPAPANTAPQLNTAASPALAPVAEDTLPPGDPVSRLLGTSVTDPDPVVRAGAAVVGLTGTADGQWQYSTTGGKKWAAMAAISEAHALLLRDTDLVRFVPARDFNGTRTILFRAWDQTAGTVGQYADLTAPGATGGAAAVSPEADTASVAVKAVNDAPGFNTIRPARFTAVAQGAQNPPGDTVAALLGSSVTDVDAESLQGIAVTKVDAILGGTWEYRLSGLGLGWQVLLPDAVNYDSALALRPEDEIRLVLTDSLFVGDRTLQFVAWDQSTWEFGNQVPARSGGTAFSKAVRTAVVTVTPGNVRPILDPKGVRNLSAVTPDAGDPPGDTVAALLGNAIVDPDGADPQGIAVTLTDGRFGFWQYSTDGGTNWQNVGLVSRKSALLLRAEDRIRFVPAVGFRGTAKLTYLAWDQFTGAAGAKVDTTVAGTTAFSLRSAASLVKVNTAPTLDV